MPGPFVCRTNSWRFAGAVLNVILLPSKRLVHGYTIKISFSNHGQGHGPGATHTRISIDRVLANKLMHGRLQGLLNRPAPGIVLGAWAFSSSFDGRRL